MKRHTILKKIAAVALCLTAALTTVTGAGMQNSFADMSVSVSAAETELKLNKTEKDMLPYYYQKMTKSEKSNYLKLRKAILTQKTTVKLDKLSNDTLNKLIDTAYYYDDLTFNLVNVSGETGPSYSNLKLKYQFSKKSYIMMVNKLDEKAKAVNAKFTEKTSTYTKIKYIHDYIIKNCVYDKNAQTKDTAYGALIAKKADCDGYSKAFSYLCRSAGIWTVNVIGDSGEPHMWNKVYYNKRWYGMDVTWDDPDMPLKANSSYMYFMVSDSTLNKTHKEDPVPYEVPDAKDGGKTYYRVNKLCAKDVKTARSMLISGIASAASKGKTSFTIQLADDETYNSVVEYIQKDNMKNGLDILQQASEKTKAKLITRGCQGLGEPNTRTYTFYFYYKGTKMTDYYKTLSVIDASTKEFLRQLGLKEA